MISRRLRVSWRYWTEEVNYGKVRIAIKNYTTSILGNKHNYEHQICCFK